MNLTQTDLDLIYERLIDVFSPEHLETLGWLDRQPDAEVRRTLAEADIEFFARFYLQEHFTKPPAPMHQTVYKTLTKLMNGPGRANVVFILPRGFAKTTIATLALPLWSICFRKRRHIPIISDSFPQAKDQLENLKREMEDNERILEDFGDLRGPVWQSADIETVNGVRIRALGQGMKIRGRKYRRERPDLVILDDIEELEGVQSQIQRDALHNWFMRSVMKAGWEQTKVVVLGNFLHEDCLLARLQRNPMFRTYVYQALPSWPENMDLWNKWREVITNLGDSNKEETARKFYEANEEAMLLDAVSAWPQAFPVYDLMLIRVTGGDSAFQTELQNDISDPARRLFKTWHLYRREVRAGEVWLTPLSGRPAVRLTDCILFAATDPSMGKTTSSDPSAITILARSPTRELYVLESDKKRRPPEKIINDQIEYCKEHRITRWGIESNQFQALFATQSFERAKEQGINLPVVPVNHLSNKAMRIQSLQPDLENGFILVPEYGADGLKHELAHWPMTGQDDALDSLETARGLAKEWLPQQLAEIVQGEIYDFGQNAPMPRPVEEDIYAEADAEADENMRELRRALGFEVQQAEEIFVPRMMR